MLSMSVRASPLSCISIPWVREISFNRNLASTSFLPVPMSGGGRKRTGWLVGVWELIGPLVLLAPLNRNRRLGCTPGVWTEFSRSGELGGVAFGLSGVASGMGWRLGMVWGLGGGDEGVSMSIASCCDRGADLGRNFWHLNRLLYWKSESTGQNSA